MWMPWMPLAAARIRIPIPVPSELAPWVVGLFLLVFVVVTIALTRRFWFPWGLAAWGVLGVGWTASRLAQGAAVMDGRFFARLAVINLVLAGVLVCATLLFWGARRRIDIAGALLAALVYGLLAAPLQAAMFGTSPRLASFLSSILFAAGLLVVFALCVARLTPPWKAVFVGMAAGSVAGALLARLSVLAFSRFGAAGSVFTVLAGSAVEGLIVGGLAALAVRALKPRERQGRLSLAA